MTSSPSSIFAGEGASRAAGRAVDWGSTALGPIETWPISLQTTVRMLLSSRHPMFLWWGPELVQIYNDAYLPSFGRGKHPLAMGQRGADCWQEIWPIIHPQIHDVMERAKASWNEDQLVPIHRNGRIEEVYWTYGYSPIFDESGSVGGALVVCTETTSGVLAIRRLKLLRTLANALIEAQELADVARIASACLAEAPLDIPFGVIAIEDAEVHTVGLDGAVPATLSEPGAGKLFEHRTLTPGIPTPSCPEPVTEAVVRAFDGTPAGTITFGLSPRLPFDEPYKSFLQQVVEQISIALGRVGIDIERRRLLLQAPVPTAILTGPDHIYTIANPRYVEMVGREVLGKRYLDAFPELRDTALPRILDNVYRQGEPFRTHEMPLSLVGSDGVRQDRFFNFSLEPIRDVRGNVYGMMAVAVDITPLVAARRALERSHDERADLLAAARVAARAKDEFLAMLGHELRNPLAPILTALEVMKVKGAKGLEHERRIIERQASHLIHLVDDLLDVSRVVAGKIELKKRRVALAEVVGNAIEMASPLLEKRRHRVQVDVPSEGLDVTVDPTRLGQVVSNLLTNAARYTEPGGTVSIRARRADLDVVLRVEDTGIGIPAEHMSYLFERFFQGTGHRTEAQGGLGLGLALVKGLVELHGGSVRAESAGLGKGSAFEVRLALATGESPQPDVAVARNEKLEASRERVLLIDDNQDITDLVSAFLELSGFHVQTAQDGPTALRIAQAFRPTVAVLDLGLPVMDGYEIAAKLVEQLGGSAPRLIAMSGYGQAEDIERTNRAGFEQHLVKPVDGASLLRAIVGE